MLEILKYDLDIVQKLRTKWTRIDFSYLQLLYTVLASSSFTSSTLNTNKSWLAMQLYNCILLLLGLLFATLFIDTKTLLVFKLADTSQHYLPSIKKNHKETLVAKNLGWYLEIYLQKMKLCQRTTQWLKKHVQEFQLLPTFYCLTRTVLVPKIGIFSDKKLRMTSWQPCMNNKRDFELQESNKLSMKLLL